MKKPKRSDYQSGRSGAEAYQTAMKKWRASNKKVKPANNDPRPKIGNFPNREAYRQAVLKWNERRKARLKKERKDELAKLGKKDTSRGVRPSRKTSKDLKVKKGPFAKDRVGKPDLTSTSYKEAKATNESLKINQKKKVVKKKVDKKNQVENKGPNLEAANQILNKPKKETTYKDFENKDQKKTDKKQEKKRPKGSARNFIRYKGKMIRRGTPMAKKAEEIERRRKKLAAKGYMKNR